jgi:hypothetical protein
MSGFGKTCECIAVTAAMISKRISAITVYYNGQSITFGAGWGFDTQPFDDAMCTINTGTVLGALLTVKNAVYECATDDPSSATALTGAEFTDVNTANDESVRRGAVQCKDTLRYLFLRTEVVAPSTTVPTVDFSAVWIGGTAREQPTDHHLEFDV